MWDKLDIRIPFDDLHVTEISSHDGKPRGFVEVENYDFPIFADVAFLDGKAQIVGSVKSQTWGSVSSGISTVAVGFFPEGNGFYTWPHVSVKASPAKILQGHNVFGSENIRHGAMQMLATLQQAFPKIYAHLALIESTVCYVDTTYSSVVKVEAHRCAVINLFEKIFPIKSTITRYVGYIQGNNNSEYHRQKIYYKGQEVLTDLDKAKRKGERERVKILSCKKLQEFANDRLRFEGTTGKRGLERLGIPTKLNEFLKFHDWYESVHGEPLCRYLWRKSFGKYFAQLRGHTMKNVDDDNIKLMIDAKHIKMNSAGRVCRRKANAIWRTYREIKLDGYESLAKKKDATFFRNVAELVDLGLSRAFLKSLDPNRKHDNVVHLISLIDIDFQAQTPAWYVEPSSGFSDSRRHLKLVS